MSPRCVMLVLAMAALSGTALAAQPDDAATVRGFYENVLSEAASPDLAERAARVLAPGWVTRGNNDRPGGDATSFVKALGGFAAAVPDLRFAVQEIIVAGDRYVVRSRATGTPVKPFLGVEPSGRGFDVMAIDIHRLEAGRIVESFHVEDWAGAIRQLRGP